MSGAPGKSGASNGNVFDDVRRQFHDLSGLISVIFSSVDLLRADAESSAEDATEDLLTRIESTARKLTLQLGVTQRVVLDALALAPAAGRVWEIPCLIENETQQRRELKRHLERLRVDQPALGKSGVILIAPITSLPSLRRALTAQGGKLRVATAPADARFLLDSECADLIVMAPPSDEVTQWWRALRFALQGYADQPTMIHLVPVGKHAGG
jgi:hypothetical protein